MTWLEQNRINKVFCSFGVPYVMPLSDLNYTDFRRRDFPGIGKGKNRLFNQLA